MTGTPARFVDPGPEDGFYWTSGADGHLRIAGCNDCSRLHHPPTPVCPYCHSRELEPKVVSGRGTVAAFTINHQPGKLLQPYGLDQLIEPIDFDVRDGDTGDLFTLQDRR